MLIRRLVKRVQVRSKKHNNICNMLNHVLTNFDTTYECIHFRF